MMADPSNRLWKSLAGWAAIALNVVLCVGSIALSLCPPQLSWLAWAGLIISLGTAAILVRDVLSITSTAQHDVADHQGENRMLAFVVVAPVVATVAWLLFSSL